MAKSKRAHSKEKDGKSSKKRRTNNDLDEETLRRAMEAAQGTLAPAKPAKKTKAQPSHPTTSAPAGPDIPVPASKKKDAKNVRTRKTRNKEKKRRTGENADSTSGATRGGVEDVLMVAHQPISLPVPPPVPPPVPVPPPPPPPPVHVPVDDTSNTSASHSSSSSDSTSDSSSSSSDKDVPGDDEAYRLRPHNPSSGDDTETQTRKRHEEHLRGLPEVQVGPSVQAYQPLAERRQSAPSARPQTPPSGVSTSAARAAKCTPYQRCPGPKKPSVVREGDFTPPSKEVVQEIKPLFRLFLATRNAYPSMEAAAKYLDQDVHGKLSFYLPFETASALRGHVFTAAKSVVIDNYLAGTQTGRARRRLVKKLLKRNAFIYANTSERLGMFEHPAIRSVIRQAFFVSSLPAYNLGADRAHIPHFKGLPDPLIALACTAIAGALTVWTDGYEKNIKFTATAHEDLYLSLRKKLDK
ncbi:hypothetical protein AURDEDRAFT_154033, partial [Auricularia subglabra TFB-10046 SS5]